MRPIFPAINEELARDNAELTRINGKLQKMYARAEDRVRERGISCLQNEDPRRHPGAVLRPSGACCPAKRRKAAWRNSSAPYRLPRAR